MSRHGVVRREQKGNLLRIAVIGLIAILNSQFSIYNLNAQVMQGYASYYSRKSAGLRTASGERLYNDSLTCAHRTLPFGTLLKVTNLKNNLSVVVKVNDRGPFIRGRIIDLSWAAAKEIGLLADGIARVTVEEANRITIPFKAPPLKIELPQFEVPLIELPDTLRTIWQEDELIEHPKRKKTKGRKKTGEREKS